MVIEKESLSKISYKLKYQSFKIDQDHYLDNKIKIRIFENAQLLQKRLF